MKIKTEAIILDLDGTLCDNTERSNIIADPREWTHLYTSIPNDKLNTWAYELAVNMSVNGLNVLLVTGRPAKYRKTTNNWLKTHCEVKFYDSLYMRLNNDFRPDHFVKKDILKTILLKHDVLFAIDDRVSVCNMFYDEGITALYCGGKL